MEFGMLFVVMEYCVQSLQAILDGHRIGLPYDLFRELATQLCSGLGAIHALGIVHGDLKPSNIMFTR